MLINAFGKKVSRNKAEKIIINDFIGDICHARNTDTLENLLVHGWKGLEKWSDKEIQDYIEELLPENQP
jgi:hypothetical protein